MAITTTFSASGSGDDDSKKFMANMSKTLGPGRVEQAINQAIQLCWMSLPEDRRNVTEVEKEIRRIMERSHANHREDASAFGCK